MSGGEELETRIAYQDDAIEQLSDLVYQQSQALALLTERCRQLEARVQSLAESERGADEDAPPPHY